MKNILLVGFPTLNYLHEIKKELEQIGFKVTYYDIEPWTTKFKILKRVSKTRYSIKRDTYQTKIIQTCKVEKYEYIIFIQPHRFSYENLRSLREGHPEAQFILYNWDSLRTYDYRPYLDLFDRTYTFDKQDSQTLNIQYLPLFATRDYQGISTSLSKRPIVYFAGRIDSINRYLVLRSFGSFCRENDIEFRCYMLTSASMNIKLLVNGHIPIGTSRSPMRSDELQKWIRESTAVFDYPNHSQCGYTMRVIENLCAGKKIITSNAAVEGEPFFDETQLKVFRTLDFTGVKEFLNTPVNRTQGRLDQFHIQAFVKRLING